MIYVAMADINMDLSQMDERYSGYIERQLKSISKVVGISTHKLTFQRICYVDHNMIEHILRVDYKNIILWEE